MNLKIAAGIHLYYSGNMSNKFEWSTMSNKMWFITITVKFSQKRDYPITIFEVYPPLTTPKKLKKELTFKTTSYRELLKWLKKNQTKVGIFFNLKL